MTSITWHRSQLIFDVANMAYIMARSRLANLPIPALTRLMDVADHGNIDRIHRVFSLEMATAASRCHAAGLLFDYDLPPALQPQSHDTIIHEPAASIAGRFINSPSSEDFVLHLRNIPEADARSLTELMHELLVRSALADWLCLTIGPEPCKEWHARVSDARAALYSAITSVSARSSTTQLSRLRRPLSPF